MMHKRIILPMLLGAMMLGACGGKQTPEVDPAALEAQRLAEEEAARRAAEEEAARRAAEEEARRRAEEARRAREAAAREAARAREILDAMVFFEYDQFQIRDDMRSVLTSKVGVLRANSDVVLRIEGHADERGSDEYNLALGLRRANAVKDFLTGYGLDAARFETKSFGEDQPLEMGSTEDAWAKNRRAEFKIVSGEAKKAQ